METFFSAVLGDLLSRSISFVIDRYQRQQQDVEENLQRLHRVLLRIQAIVEEADERRITNQAMLLQLRVVRATMYRGYYFLDSFRHRVIQAHAQDENCMFGRQAEQERVINFLLQPQHPCARGIDVLPIIGPGRVGKRTLVEHVCHDERVRKYFTIVFYGPDSIGGGDMELLADNGVIKHRNPASTEQLLVIIELVNDMDDKTWRRILHSLRGNHVSKIILTSRSNKIATLGTTEALHLDFLPREAFWYFFKTIAFGSTNPEDEPMLASICMEIVTVLKGSFMALHILGGILRSNPSAQFWYRFLKCLKYYTDKHIYVLGEHPSYAYRKRNGLTFIWTSQNQRVIAVRYSIYQSSSARPADLRMFTSSDILTRNVELPEKFDVLDWQSSIPPYYCYMTHYEKLARQPHMLPKRKRSRLLSEGLV
ncbi:putative disease resistance protein RGA4 isoform X2 [Oryza brachyantha]|uniref:putative disease resistance protein RGA4 isoform X2 n=1 Tax=Oryza brachyantha TaxID=4533 RepID=UPI001ADB2F59|nr:putative disease resistance protein RGA4 isoform X2 [Oryza brachyantha]